MTRTRKRIVQLMADGIADADITQAIVREVAIPKRLTGEITESGLAGRSSSPHSSSPTLSDPIIESDWKKHELSRVG